MPDESRQSIVSPTQPAPACSSATDDLAALLGLACDFRWEWDAALRFSALSGPPIDAGLITPAQLIGARVFDWPSHLLRDTALFGAARAAAHARQTFRSLHFALSLNDDTRHWFSLSGMPRFDAERHFTGYQGIAIDITHTLQEEERFRHLAYHDALTGLPNRRLFSDRLDQAIHQARRTGTRLALMMIDLDQFKRINDRWGHAAGDRALITVATALKRGLRQSDTLARLGGDEFIALLPRAGSDADTLRLARKLLDAIAGAGPFMQSASIGVSLFPDHGIDTQGLILRADQAMYVAKREGGHGVRMASGQV